MCHRQTKTALCFEGCLLEKTELRVLVALLPKREVLLAESSVTNIRKFLVFYSSLNIWAVTDVSEKDQLAEESCYT